MLRTLLNKLRPSPSETAPPVYVRQRTWAEYKRAKVLRLAAEMRANQGRQA